MPGTGNKCMEKIEFVSGKHTSPGITVQGHGVGPRRAWLHIQTTLPPASMVGATSSPLCERIRKSHNLIKAHTAIGKLENRSAKLRYKILLV